MCKRTGARKQSNEASSARKQKVSPGCLRQRPSCGGANQPQRLGPRQRWQGRRRRRGWSGLPLHPELRQHQGQRRQRTRAAGAADAACRGRGRQMRSCVGAAQQRGALQEAKAAARCETRAGASLAWPRRQRGKTGRSRGPDRSGCQWRPRPRDSAPRPRRTSQRRAWTGREWWSWARRRTRRWWRGQRRAGSGSAPCRHRAATAFAAKAARSAAQTTTPMSRERTSEAGRGRTVSAHLGAWESRHCAAGEVLVASASADQMALQRAVWRSIKHALSGTVHSQTLQSMTHRM